MAFYQTNNSSIVRFTVHDPARQVIAPFATLQRVVQIQNVGSGTGAHYTGTRTAGGNVVLDDNSWLLTPEQLANGSLIINPTGAGGNATCDRYTLPSAYDLQQFLGGRGAFNMAANLVNVAAGANPMNGSNDFFVLNVYNLATHTGYFVAYNNGSTKPIVAAPAANDAEMTPVLVQFSGVNSPYPTINGVQNSVSYTLY
jgi:hypothetical protein